MRHHFEQVGLEHAGRFDEQPVGGIDDFEVGLVVHGPDLAHEGLIRIHHALDLPFKTTHNHGVGHHQGQWVMRFHLLRDVFGAIVEDKTGASRVMVDKCGGI